MKEDYFEEKKQRVQDGFSELAMEDTILTIKEYKIVEPQYDRRINEVEKNILLNLSEFRTTSKEEDNGILKHQEGRIIKNRINNSYINNLGYLESFDSFCSFVINLNSTQNNRNIEKNRSNRLNKTTESTKINVYEKSINLFLKVFLSLWVLAFCLGLILGNANKPYTKNPKVDTQKQLASIGYNAYFKKTYSYNESESGLAFEDLLSRDTFISKFIYNPDLLTPRELVNRNPIILALNLTTIRYNNREYYFDFQTGNIGRRSLSKHDSPEYKLYKKGLKDFDWLNYVEGIGVYKSTKFLLKEMPQLIKETKSKNLMLSIFTLGAASAFYLGYDWANDNELPENIISDSDVWLQAFEVKMIEENGKRHYLSEESIK